MKRIAVLIDEDAARQIDAARAWWAENRGTNDLDTAIAKTLRRLEAFPESAPRVQIRGRWSTTRRASIDHGYQLYYRYNASAGTILVRCFWHERRPLPRL